MPRRRGRLPFNSDDDRDYMVDDVVESFAVEPEAPIRRAAREPERRELPPRAPVPLSAIELAWSLNDEWIEPYLVRSVELAGGFRPMLQRAGLTISAGD